MKNAFRILVLLSLLPAFSRAEDAPLDPPYKGLVHPQKNLLALAADRARSKNNALTIIAKQSSVKNQASRGTCSIFSATALLESMLIKEGKAEPSIDLSEEWLQYVIAQNATSEGSNSTANFAALRNQGIPSEEKMPYIGQTWSSLTDGDAGKRCGHLEKTALARCLTGHRDPTLLSLSDDLLLSASSDTTSDRTFFYAREEARENKKRFFNENGARETGVVTGLAKIKNLLDSGTPLNLDIDFYYGAWNHRGAEPLGISKDPELWKKGIVTYPENGSMDLMHSNDKPAGHSVVVVGYDDDVELEYSLKMTNGNYKTFKRKGVYYFKNSWGSSSFGVNFELEGTKLPGYGMISQDYADDYGQFFRLSL